ncbi:MAG: HEAT repeat domain-containing protein [Bryobacterales bacterium]|nr:HEAT repeat domain-containing protein [Bryobacteraceae bacterium]MDW8354327.1 HEAT repeat domain-containing protein [Bryobacterales bacterium]
MPQTPSAPQTATAQPSGQAPAQRPTLGQQAVQAMPHPAEEKWREIWSLQPSTLLVLLKDPGASVFLKAKICQRLAEVGGKEAVAAVAALLENPQLSTYARFTLEAVPDPSADAALREAARKLQGTLLAGVLNSIGVRRDAAAVPLLAQRLQDSDATVAQAAAAALGQIGTEQAARSLMDALQRRRAELRPALHDAALVCGERLEKAGRASQARTLYEAVLGDQPAPAVASVIDRRLGELRPKAG